MVVLSRRVSLQASRPNDREDIRYADLCERTAKPMTDAGAQAKANKMAANTARIIMLKMLLPLTVLGLI